MILIRRAELSDTPELADMAKRAHEKSPFKSAALNEIEMKRQIMMHITMPNRCCYVAVEDEKIIGAITGMLGTNIWGMLTAMDTGVFADKKGAGPGLVRRYHGWAKQYGASIIAMSNTHSDNRYDGFLSKLGMQETGKQFIEVVT